MRKLNQKERKRIDGLSEQQLLHELGRNKAKIETLKEIIRELDKKDANAYQDEIVILNARNQRISNRLRTM